ncbi:MAG: carboxypeptidase-like regulatory domain-containing protein [Oscillospiraceae bacterium]|jgi:hypothetical protein|nr:carboxypeptidase-like regulatory domain-containing protein [Oscillospiraceae bacterium]
MFHRYLKRAVSLVLTAVLLIGIVPSNAFAADTPSAWAVETVSNARSLGLTTSELLNDFSATTTRLEFCRAAVNLLRQYGYDLSSVSPKLFSDTNDRDVGIAAALGIAAGTDTAKNTFTPNNPLTREQAATLLNNVLAVLNKKTDTGTVIWTDAGAISAWAAQSANDLYNHGVISGTSTASLVFSPKVPYTHEQSIVTLVKLWNYLATITDEYNTYFDPENLRDSANKVILNDEVKVVTSNSATNRLINVDTAKRLYTFENINNEFRYLVRGDKFAIEPCTAVPNGLAVIVADIKLDGNTAVIIGAEAVLGDFVKSMDVAQVVPLTTDMITDLGEGVTPLKSGRLPQMNSAGNVGLSLEASASYSDKYKVEIKVNGGFIITGEFAIGAVLMADVDLHEGWFGFPTGVDSFTVALSNSIVSTLKLETTFNSQILDMANVYRLQDGKFKEKYANFQKTKAECDEYRHKLFTSGFPIPTTPGLLVTVTWYLNVNASGQISITAEYSQNNTFGITYRDGEWSKINNNDKTVTLDGAANAKLYIGCGLGIGISYLELATAAIEPEAGIEITAKSEMDDETIAYFLTGKIPENAETFHDCLLCVDGDINLVVQINATVDALGFGTVFKGKLLKPLTIKIGDFYVALGGRNHENDYGLGECPYLFVKFSGKVIDADSKEPIPNAILSFSNENTVTTDSNGKYQIFLNANKTSSYTVSAKDYGKRVLSVDVQDKPVSATIEMKPEKIPFTGIVIDADTKEPIAGVDIAFPNMDICQTDYNGNFIIMLEGNANYIYTVFSAGYTKQELSVTVADKPIDVQIKLKNNHRYQIFDIGMTWHEAELYCESLGGHLVTITTVEERDLVESLIASGVQNQYWLGADSPGNWVTGEVWDNSLWKGTKANNYRGVESYIQMYRVKNPKVSGSKLGDWNDITVDNSIPGEENYFSLEYIGFVCEWE